MSWYDLLSIAANKIALTRQEKQQGPSACPNDGTPLTPTPDGASRFCSFDGYTWPRDGWGSIGEPR